MTELEMAPLSEQRARELIDGITRSITDAREAIIEAYRGRAWVALGYPSWEQLCDAEFGVRVQLPADQRMAFARELREAGMPQRAIGSAVGVDHSTISRGLSGGAFAPPGPKFVTGQDGKHYPAISEKRAEAQAAGDQHGYVGFIARKSTLDLIAALRGIAALDDEVIPGERDLILGRINEIHAAATEARQRLNGIRRVK